VYNNITKCLSMHYNINDFFKSFFKLEYADNISFIINCPIININNYTCTKPQLLVSEQ